MTRRSRRQALTALAAVMIAAGIFAVALAVARSHAPRQTAGAVAPHPDLADDVVEVKPAPLDVPAPVETPPPSVRQDRATDDTVDELRDRRLLIPVAGVNADDLFDSFDEIRGGSRRHEAIDILAPRGTPVLAVENGTVARLFLSEAGGTTVYQFDPSRRFVYYYAHLDAYAPGLAEKAPVARGQVLGYVGTSGNAPENTPHLHFAVFRLTEARRWWEGTPIDPFQVLKD